MSAAGATPPLSTVRFNTGLGPALPIGGGVALAILIVGLVIGSGGDAAVILAFLPIYLGVGLIAFAALWLTSPRPFTIDVPAGTVRTRHGDVPFADVTRLGAYAPSRGSDRLVIATARRFPLAKVWTGWSVRRPMDAEQWGAVRALLEASAAPGFELGRFGSLPKSGHAERMLDRADALALIDAQLAWSSSRGGAIRSPLWNVLRGFTAPGTAPSA